MKCIADCKLNNQYHHSVLISEFQHLQINERDQTIGQFLLYPSCVLQIGQCFPAYEFFYFEWLPSKKL